MDISFRKKGNTVEVGDFIGDPGELMRACFQVFICMDKMIRKYCFMDAKYTWFRQAVRDYLIAPETYQCIKDRENDGKV